MKYGHFSGQKASLFQRGLYQIASAINNAFESHWEELFIPDPIVNDKKVAFRRHNNGLESSHRKIRKAIRERTGRSETNSEMEQFEDCEAFLITFLNVSTFYFHNLYYQIFKAFIIVPSLLSCI